MARLRTVHRCTECGAGSPQWVGRCPGCGEWNTLVEEVEPVGNPRSGGGPAPAPPSPPVLLSEVAADAGTMIPSGLPELDRVLGGGFVPGSATLIGGEPGIGKSTLLLQAAATMVRRGSRCLLVCAEESPAQVRLRAERLNALIPGLWLIGESSMPAILAAISQVTPDVVVVDSIQTVWDPELESTPGSVGQVRTCAHQLVTAAKSGGPAVIMVGHVTKEGSLAGPRVLEHVVDTVLSFDGDRHHAIRLLRAVKHRFGATGELGLFEMTGSGLEAVADPAGLFLADRRPGNCGSVVFPSMEGYRPLLVEIQALVVPTPVPSPRRSVSGFDGGRLSLLLAVLDRRVGLSLAGHEVYVSVVGGIKVADPGADLAVCLALASALTCRPVHESLVVLGEVGLGGEVRQVGQTPRRLSEAARLGFTRALIPARAPGCDGMSVRRAATLLDALQGDLGPVSTPPQLQLVGASAGSISDDGYRSAMDAD
jgi:DNA repair protein RadA/Sms